MDSMERDPTLKVYSHTGYLENRYNNYEPKVKTKHMNKKRKSSEELWNK